MTDSKQCTKCGQVKDSHQFCRKREDKNGLASQCKECERERRAAYAKNNNARIREKDRRYRANNIDKTRALQLAYREKFKLTRMKATMAVNNAVRRGKLTPMPCLVCGEKAHAHHPDYDRPLDVVWLCPSHHREVHAMVREAT